MQLGVVIVQSFEISVFGAWMLIPHWKLANFFRWQKPMLPSRQYWLCSYFIWVRIEILLLLSRRFPNGYSPQVHLHHHSQSQSPTDFLENGHHLSNQPQNCEMSINSVKLWSSNSKTTFKCSARYFLGHLWKNRMMLQLWLLMDERKCFPMWNTIHLFFVFVVRNLPQICHWTLLMFSNDTKYSSTLG